MAAGLRMLLGPAGSGKTYQCLEEIRRALKSSPMGESLVLLAPKQSTFQLERQLLETPGLEGYTRLRIVPFGRLAEFALEALGQPAPKMLDEEGRLMVLRGLLARMRPSLRLFRASARLTGFAQQLSEVLSELQRHQQTPATLRSLAGNVSETPGLNLKLEDLASILEAYLAWLAERDLRDADSLLSAAAEALEKTLASAATSPTPFIHTLWVDGFVEFSPQERDFLGALLPFCGQATVTFCLEQRPSAKTRWISPWAVVAGNYEKCRERFERGTGLNAEVQLLKRDPKNSRFAGSAALQHLERCWVSPEPFSGATNNSSDLAASLRVVSCANPETEAVVVAREILQGVRAGGRFRDSAVLLRTLAGYHDVLERVFSRYQIPFFLDRRESVAHHPLAELTRSALRTVAFKWQHEDWFAALKTGFTDIEETEIDRLENEALGRGWRGAVWKQPLEAGESELSRWARNIQDQLTFPYLALARTLEEQCKNPTGPQLAAALRAFWAALGVEDKLAAWAAESPVLTRSRVPASVHSTVWEQMNGWLGNLELGFPAEQLSLREWLPILDTGLANLTVGVIPPALDQVTIGTLDRSRNPRAKTVFLMGWNETVFPAPPPSPILLTGNDREQLEKMDVDLEGGTRQHLSRERHHAYLACTRARERMVVTFAAQNTQGASLNPSPFLSQLEQLFPSLTIEAAPRFCAWRESEHLHELIGPVLKASRERPALLEEGPVGAIPAVTSLVAQLRQFHVPDPKDQLAPELIQRLFRKSLRSSVSRLEEYAACPFRFFVKSALRAEERKVYEADIREQGSFQHEVLAEFHLELQGGNQRWRDITPPEARERVGRIAERLAATYRGGLLQSTDQTRFLARVLTASLQDFVETLVTWMRQQYQFDPVSVEVPFGRGEKVPAWELELSQGNRLELRGRIDRIDLCKKGDGSALCVVIDYKSSLKKLETILIDNGLQLQLLSYLNVLKHWPDPGALLGVKTLIPTGVFYVNLKGTYEGQATRQIALGEAENDRKAAYQHLGRFDAQAIPQLDSRGSDKGDQFRYRLTKDGEVYANCAEALPPGELASLLGQVEENLRKMGEEIFAGRVGIDPYRRGQKTACDTCEYGGICRIDPWAHPFRVLKPGKEAKE